MQCPVLSLRDYVICQKYEYISVVQDYYRNYCENLKFCGSYTLKIHELSIELSVINIKDII